MKVYLVGGAVRDKLLGLKIKERDYVVVGATVDEMLSLGFKKVGKDFPVFLHPQTHEEYALARTEKKTTKGYRGFICHTDPSVTLEDDLRRRDLTINAMAEDYQGKLIDPYQGRIDIKKKLLRHVSPAFSEDPVRILRIARFAARLNNFSVAPETNQLMLLMVRGGEVDALTPERVWQELARALAEHYPKKFFEVLHDCDALEKLFPEFLPTLIIIQKTLDNTVTLDLDTPYRFAALAMSISSVAIKNFANRYKIPKIYSSLALLGIKIKEQIKTLSSSSSAIVQFLEICDSYRRPKRLELILRAHQAYILALSDHSLQSNCYKTLIQAYEFTKTVHLDQATIEAFPKFELARLLHERRVTILQSIYEK